MEVQDKELLKTRGKAARQLLEKKFIDPKTPDSTDDIVNDAVKDSVSVYHKHIKKDFLFFSKNMVEEVEQINNHYHSVLGLLAAFAETAALDKKSDFRNLVNNVWIKAIGANPELKKALMKGNAGWQGKMDKVRGWFRDVIKTDTEFQKFNRQESPSIEDQKSIIKHIARKLILGKGLINSYFEEEDLRWTEDQDIVRSL